jgi:hypothetical protein
VGVRECQKGGVFYGRFSADKRYQHKSLHYGMTVSRLEATVLHDLMTIKLLGAQEAR